MGQKINQNSIILVKKTAIKIFIIENQLIK